MWLGSERQCPDWPLLGPRARPRSPGGASGGRPLAGTLAGVLASPSRRLVHVSARGGLGTARKASEGPARPPEAQSPRPCPCVLPARPGRKAGPGPGGGEAASALMRTGGHFNVLYSRGCWPLLPQPHPRFLPVLFASQVNAEHWGPPLSTTSTRSRSCHGPSLAPGCSPSSCITYPSVAQAG